LTITSEFADDTNAKWPTDLCPAPTDGEDLGRRIHEIWQKWTGDNLDLASAVTPAAAKTANLVAPCVDKVVVTPRVGHSSKIVVDLGENDHEECTPGIDRTCPQPRSMQTSRPGPTSKIKKPISACSTRAKKRPANTDTESESDDNVPLGPPTIGSTRQRRHELQILLQGRATQRLVEKTEDAYRAAGKIMVDQSERKKRAKADNKAKGEPSDDPFAEEIMVMAKVRGYHDFALHRLVDHVHQGIQAGALPELDAKLYDQLKLGLEAETNDAQNRCKELLAEDREREIRHKELQQERSNFIEAQRKLAAIGQIGEHVASLSAN
ncbi:hypothetical protein KCU99_g10136, partial [Aureobasidium melanogenum]